MSFLIRTLAALTCVGLLTASTAAAQVEPGRLAGLVTDESGGFLPGVAVTIVSPRLRGPIVIVTDHTGRYTSPALAPGA